MLFEGHIRKTWRQNQNQLQVPNVVRQKWTLTALISGEVGFPLGVGAVRCFCVATIYPSLHGESLTTTLRRKGCRCSSVEKSLLSVAKSLSLIPEFAKNKRLKMGGGGSGRSRGRKTGEGSKENEIMYSFCHKSKALYINFKKENKFLKIHIYLKRRSRVFSFK